MEHIGVDLDENVENGHQLENPRKIHVDIEQVKELLSNGVHFHYG